ncbi:MAG: aminotransferase class V-fold PLP-dependent enzyme [Psychroserpens sp.]|nr:aminotransferase class V-fold PLP-dependent enzyme [Psychroserpens sp.]MBO6632405.1 aminotransferase class V-fold PLP-dependent enzyme [Psychroserpens sp.]MBO6654597.1 aminotransferase class V-fold PLP-dependent enzyme [Psychroserpens sp.]MBO6681056.1 aminotransferase class V-fold PLP-dependent enzyme [Psychroserpens sp.]MBO6749989.1 aminotransferase class V-fold PLP-dependent enzyme [Psychroserpens sp.]
MKLSNQKELFDIPEDITYLNIASLSPSFKTVEQAGLQGVLDKSKPYRITASDFFEPVSELKALFAQLVDTNEPERVVTIPSVSYGMATVANNIILNKGDEIIVVDEQFPSNIYAWQKLVEKYDAKIITIHSPELSQLNAETWNQEILNAINERTALVALGNIHWSNGSIFNLKSIREKTRAYNALLVVDGSQTIGAFPFSINEIQPDALVCAGYKWLFGPYGCAYAYYGPYFDNGEPIENNWANRMGSENLAGLTNYQHEYKPLANRYAVGESGNFISVKMQTVALKQVLEWSPEAIQDYCKSISLDAANELEALGCKIEHSDYRTHHLFGIKLPESLSMDSLKHELLSKNVFVSYRGDYLRLSCHLYNTSADFEPIVDWIKRNNS